MKLIRTLIEHYLSLTAQLQYYVTRKNIAQIDKFEREQRETALKLILAIAKFHAIDDEEIEEAMNNDVLENRSKK